MLSEEVVLRELTKPSKRKRVMMPNWIKPESRSEPNAICAFEVYGNPSNLLNETETITSLQSLKTKGVVKSKITSAGTCWWCLK